jgi:hypothetical protein
VITLGLSPAAVAEDGTANLVYTFSRTGSTASELTVSDMVSGSATLGMDYTGIGSTPASVTFAGGAATATVTVDPTADTTAEVDETVLLTLVSGTGYDIGIPAAAVAKSINTNTTSNVLVEEAGLVKLLRDGQQRFFAQTGSGEAIGIMNGGTQIYQGTYGREETLGVETITGVDTVMWKNVPGNDLTQRTMDGSWRYVSSQGQWGLFTVEGMEQERRFAQDFNGDGVIGQVYQQVDGAGFAKLLKDANKTFYAQTGSGELVGIMNGEAQVCQGIYGGWEMLGVETIAGVNTVMLKNVAGNYLTQWTMDGSWRYVSSQGQCGLFTAEGMAQESRFAQDFNGDGVIGSVI